MSCCTLYRSQLLGCAGQPFFRGKKKWFAPRQKDCLRLRAAFPPFDTHPTEESKALLYLQCEVAGIPSKAQHTGAAHLAGGPQCVPRCNTLPENSVCRVCFQIQRQKHSKHRDCHPLRDWMQKHKQPFQCREESSPLHSND